MAPLLKNQFTNQNRTTYACYIRTFDIIKFQPEGEILITNSLLLLDMNLRI